MRQTTSFSIRGSSYNTDRTCFSFGINEYMLLHWHCALSTAIENKEYGTCLYRNSSFYGLLVFPTDQSVGIDPLLELNVKKRAVRELCDVFLIQFQLKVFPVC